MESIITNDGFDSLICWTISNTFVSAKTYSKSAVIPRRSARSFVCCVDSSPETYNTGNFFSANEADICKRSVDFPIPGSPPIKTSEPGTTPPPKTRLNSLIDVVIRGEFSDAIAVIFSGLLPLCKPPDVRWLALFEAIYSSTSVFQLLHPGHFPIHLDDSKAHSLHTCFVFRLATQPKPITYINYTR